MLPAFKVEIFVKLKQEKGEEGRERKKEGGGSIRSFYLSKVVNVSIN